jgi:hypothetical protein
MGFAPSLHVHFHTQPRALLCSLSPSAKMLNHSPKVLGSVQSVTENRSHLAHKKRDVRLGWQSLTAIFWQQLVVDILVPFGVNVESKRQLTA